VPITQLSRRGPSGDSKNVSTASRHPVRSTVRIRGNGCNRIAVTHMHIINTRLIDCSLSLIIPHKGWANTTIIEFIAVIVPIVVLEYPLLFKKYVKNGE
jgi:hypothetical protein